MSENLVMTCRGCEMHAECARSKCVWRRPAAIVVSAFGMGAQFSEPGGLESDVEEFDRDC